MDEDLADLRAYDGAKAALATGEGELVPADYAKGIAGESPLRVWRELRGPSQFKLGARQSGGGDGAKVGGRAGGEGE